MRKKIVYLMAISAIFMASPPQGDTAPCQASDISILQAAALEMTSTFISLYTREYKKKGIVIEAGKFIIDKYSDRGTNAFDYCVIDERIKSDIIHVILDALKASGVKCADPEDKDDGEKQPKRFRLSIYLYNPSMNTRIIDGQSWLIPVLRLSIVNDTNNVIFRTEKEIIEMKKQANSTGM